MFHHTDGERKKKKKTEKKKISVRTCIQNIHKDLRDTFKTFPW